MQLSSGNFNKSFRSECLRPDGGKWEVTGLDNYKSENQYHDMYADSLVMVIDLASLLRDNEHVSLPIARRCNTEE
jgi:hypothetical protein